MLMKGNDNLSYCFAHFRTRLKFHRVPLQFKTQIDSFDMNFSQFLLRILIILFYLSEHLVVHHSKPKINPEILQGKKTISLRS